LAKVFAFNMLAGLTEAASSVTVKKYG
jgi:hypothetical protein